jgi:hypothetical protein
MPALFMTHLLSDWRFHFVVIDAAQKVQVTVREVKEREESGDKGPIKR